MPSRNRCRSRNDVSGANGASKLGSRNEYWSGHHLSLVKGFSDDERSFKSSRPVVKSLKL